jgi:hypothetical protein
MKKNHKDSADFWHRNDFENQNCAIFDLQNQKEPNV